MEHYYDTGMATSCYIPSNSPNTTIINDSIIQRPKWNPSVYHKMRSVYVDVVGEKESTISSDPSEAANAMSIPYEIQHLPEKGRGIIATEFIPKHTMVWSGEDHAVFTKEEQFTKFLELIGYDLACDVLMWAYVEPASDEDYKKAYAEDETAKFRVGVELGDASLMNSIDEEDGVDAANVIDCGDLIKKGVFEDCSGRLGALYSTRDIQAGEEILTNYSDFSFDDKILWFDELWAYAWWDKRGEEEETKEIEEDDGTIEQVDENTHQEEL